MSMVRLYRINKVILEHGLDELIPKNRLPRSVRFVRILFFWLKNKHKDLSEGERLRLALQSLGPVFIKFGQMLSTRKDLLSDNFAKELTRLQDQVEPFDSAIAHELICKALEIESLSTYFSEIDEAPLASASIAQVYGAVLKENDEPVVVKILRPEIKQVIDADVKLMGVMAKVVQKFLPEGKRLRPVEVVDEYKRAVYDELDLLKESANGVKLKSNFEGSSSLYVPKIYSAYSRKNMLVMERIYGTPVADVEALEAQNTNMKRLAEKGVEVFFTQVFRDSFFHADMHPGNIFVSTSTPEDPQYIAIDFGIVGTLNSEDKRYLAENFIAFFNQDYRKVAQLHADSGWVPSDTDIDGFERSIRTVCEPIFQKPLAEISFGNVLVQLFTTARQFNMVIQPQLVLLQKTLLYVEGLGRQLYPQLDLWQTAKPFLENWMNEQMGAAAMFRKVKANLPFWTEKLPEMPDLLHDSLTQVKALPFQLDEQHKANSKNMNTLMKVIFSMLSGIMSLLLFFVLANLWQQPIINTFGVCFALVFWVYALRQIR